MRMLVAHLLRQMGNCCRIWQDGYLAATEDPSGKPKAEARWGPVSTWTRVTRVVNDAAKAGYLEKVGDEWVMTQAARAWLLEEYKQWHEDPERAMSEMLFTPLPHPPALMRQAEKVRLVRGVDRVEIYDGRIVAWADSIAAREDARMVCWRAPITFEDPDNG